MRGHREGCAHAFTTGGVTVYQSLLSRSGAGGQAEMPLSRAHLVMTGTAPD